jgi:hypothetical protein
MRKELSKKLSKKEASTGRRQKKAAVHILTSQQRGIVLGGFFYGHNN